MVGKALTTALAQKGYQVHALVRRNMPDTKQVSYFFWDIEKGIIDKACMEDVEAIIHLAGENIGKKPWSRKIRTGILNSRVDSLALLYKLLPATPHCVKCVISASATGYYGDNGEEWLTEDKAPADDFLGQTCLAWEQIVAQGKLYGLRTVSLRTGIILDKEQGILPMIAAPIKIGFGAPLGNGKQYFPWIHLQDVVRAYLFSLEHNGLHGAYNLVAPEAVTNKQLNQTLAKVLQKPLWLPPIPAFMLRVVLGKMSDSLLHSTRVSAEKLSNAGFSFEYPKLKKALTEIFTDFNKKSSPH